MQFSDLPMEQIFPVMSAVAGPVPHRHIEPTSALYQMGSISIRITTYSKNYVDGLFYKSVPDCLKNLSNIALVCQLWNEAQQLDCFWQPLLRRLSADCKFYTDLSPANTTKSKVQYFVNEMLNLKNTLIQSYETWPQVDRDFLSAITYFSKFQVNSVFVHETTDLFEYLISAKKFSTLEQHIHFKPSFDANKIAFKLFSNNMLRPEKKLCFDLLIERKYNLSKFFNKILKKSIYAYVNIFNLVVDNTKKLKITDYIESGCDFSLTEKTIPNFSLLNKTLSMLRAFYRTGEFMPPKNAISEEDLKNMIFDLLTKSGLNMDILCASSGATALEQLRQLAASLPEGNAVTGALVAYDKH